MRTLTCAGGNGHDEAEREESLVCDGNPEVGEEIDGCKKGKEKSDSGRGTPLLGGLPNVHIIGDSILDLMHEEG